MKTFVDTNVLVYAHDRAAGARHDKARTRVKQLWETRSGVVSTQVLQELYAVVTRKAAVPVTVSAARQLVKDYLAWECVVNDADAIVGAFDYESRYRISFWDALIVNAANAADADVLLTEDLNPGQRYGAVVVEDPFAGQVAR